MTRIFLVRHGQTGWNIGAGGVRFRGRTDLALDEVGLAQAKALAERLGLSVQATSGLMDIDYGDWQGKTPEEVAEAWPDLYRLWLEEPHLVEFPNGGSLEEIRARAMAALEELISRHKDQAILLVGHQVVNKVLICAMLGLDNSHFWRIRQDNGCVNIFEYRDGIFTALLINDTCHL